MINNEEDRDEHSALFEKLEKRSKYRCDLIEEMLGVMVDMFRMSLLYREKEIVKLAKKIITGEEVHWEALGSKEYAEAEKLVEKMQKK